MHSICQQIWKTQQWPQDWKRPILIPISKKSNVKECSNYNTIALMSHASKVMLKILQARCQQLSVSVQLLSRVWLFATPWAVALQIPLSMGFSRQEYWSGLPFPSSQYTSKFGKLSSDHRSVFILIPKKGNAKECSNYNTIALISQASKVMLKILQAASTVCKPRTSRCSRWI